MIYIGLIVWLILIILLMEAAVPGFIIFLLVLFGIVFIAPFVFVLINDYIESLKKKHTKCKSEQQKEKEDIHIDNTLSHKETDFSLPTNPIILQPKKIKVEIKGIEDDEKELIELGYKLSNILKDGLRHRVAVVDNIDPAELTVKKLSVSNYPFSWNRSINTERRGDLLVVDFQLPSVSDIPDFLEIVYKKEHPVVVNPNDKRIKELWTDMTYQITLRSIYELFSSIMMDEIETITFNGFVTSIDDATGHESRKCILSIMAKRKSFMDLDFTRIEPKQCFKRLKGIAAHDLSSLTPIPPIMNMSRQDNRFVTPNSILDYIDTKNNLAAMDWKDFENLIRDLFEKEFSSNGSEVNITRASKDGGVDAVVFDPDPIRGGKIVIQAKRYTNVVGVSAVRDLYGTVHNEGAIKGILVTTSDYGSDSYNFAKDKPITLLNGANLLHLMSKHGYNASIDITEAKRLLKSIDYD